MLQRSLRAFRLSVLGAALILPLAVGQTGCGKSGDRASSTAQKAASLDESRPHTATEALEQLIQGNRRFVAGHASHPDADNAWRHELVKEQHPFVTLLGCSDSRMPPELLFDQGFGDMFVVRVAGNAIDPCIEGSLEYGVCHLHTPLLLVLGHEDCGAVKAALESVDELQSEPAEIRALVRAVRPSVAQIRRQGDLAERLHAAVEANVLRVVDELRHLPALQSPISKRELLIVGGVYELETGEVHLLP